MPIHVCHSRSRLSGSAPVEELKVVGTDLHLLENRRTHHTDDYERKALIVRRGGEFKLTLNLNKNVEKNQGEKIQLQLAVGKYWFSLQSKYVTVLHK